MLGKVVFIFSALAYVNSQLVSLINPGCGCYPSPPPTIVSSCGCDIPLPSPCACGGQLLAPPPLDLLTALASLSPPCSYNAPIVAPPCSCNQLSPALLPNILASSALLPNLAGQAFLPNACGCGATEYLAPGAIYPELLINAPLSAPLIPAPSPCCCRAPVPLPTPYPCGCGVPLPLPTPCSCGCGAPLELPASTCGCGCVPALPVGCTNPFLPAASPVSAMAPQIVSPLLPPVCPCENKGLYLRKIPIPPPCI